MKETTETLKRLQAYATAEFIRFANRSSGGGCATCGYGADELMDLDDVQDLIRKFAHEQYNLKI